MLIFSFLQRIRWH